eukprot:TRINITY_DN33196_c0_g1_i1.p1 TRINITY_DN33196_c0_g1~~TRINITY_DN33196_c0_g1_i1.p1  ORF type:complete len:571 (+),score=135.24 TRINITY_DN33196_c0_g1_i1:136-1848(+)
MKAVFLAAITCLAAAISSDLWGRPADEFAPHDAGGGTSCAACVIAIGLLEQKAYLDSTTVESVLDRVCSWFPQPMSATCTFYVDTYGKEVIRRVSQHETPEVICGSLQFCTGTCTLFHAPGAHGPMAPRRPSPEAAGTAGRTAHKERSAGAASQLDPWAWLKALINKFGSDHTPLEDFDGDGFSTWAYTLRGRDWNGRDCAEFDRDTYPGSGKVGGSCNGIPAATEPDLCGSSDRRGIISIGDSAAAHFRVPPQWLNASSFDRAAFVDAMSILEDEMDWPAMSRDTGHIGNGTVVYRPTPPGPVDSNYQRLRERNRCNHRDYQLLAWNGARVGSVAKVLMSNVSVHRRSTDHPAMVFYSLVGNDVCNGHVDTISHMTKPDDFDKSVTEALHLLDGTLAKGSSVLITGLVDGRFLYNTMHDQIHPLGSTFGNARYSDVYDFLNCLQVSPCRGWLNTNETMRNLTTAHAESLNAVYPKVIAREQPNLRNLEVKYIGAWPIAKASALAKSMGFEAKDLIEPVDGFHPSTLTNFLLTRILWEETFSQPEYASIVGRVNPANDRIDKLYGNQGGY